MAFRLQAEFQPMGDQPKAIQQLAKGLDEGIAHQTFLGVTGSGKTFSIANVIQEVQRNARISNQHKISREFSGLCAKHFELDWRKIFRHLHHFSFDVGHVLALGC